MPGSTKEPNDADLIRAILAGDKDAYGSVVDRYLARVYSVAYRLLGNNADAEDVAQETFLRAFEKLHQYDMNYAFKNWLLKIATNLSLNKIRADQRRKKLHQSLADMKTGPGPDPSSDDNGLPDPFDWNPWLNRLDERQRTAVTLFHFEQMSYNDIADAMDIPVNTVKTHLHRGRKTLRQMLTQRIQVENGRCNVLM